MFKFYYDLLKSLFNTSLIEVQFYEKKNVFDGLNISNRQNNVLRKKVNILGKLDLFCIIVIYFVVGFLEVKD